MTLCDWIVLLEIAALAGAGVRIWQLGRDRDRAVTELDEACLAGAAMRFEHERAVSAMKYVGDQAGLQIAELQRRAGELNTELESCRARLHEAGARIDELIADNAAALGIQSDYVRDADERPMHALLDKGVVLP